MIAVRLSSGIGNQLFQYAFALYLRQHYQTTVYLEKSSFKYRTAQRRCDIDIVSDLPYLSDRRIYYNYRPRFYKLFKTLFDLNPFVKSIQERDLSFPEPSKFLYFDGFWQTEEFINQVPDFRACFKPKEEMPTLVAGYLKEIQSSDCISMHVRRGDYFSAEYVDRYGVCTEAYFHQALKILAVENRKIVVFSDDLDWVQSHLTLPDHTLLVQNDEINPFWYIFLMSKCKDNIVSNSSFSWWAAFLNEDPDKKVVAPRVWMKGQEKTIALDSWIKI